MIVYFKTIIIYFAFISNNNTILAKKINKLLYDCHPQSSAFYGNHANN